MCDQDFMRKIGNALPIFRAGSGSRDLPPATLDYVADLDLNAGLTKSLVESEVMRVSSNAEFRAHNRRRLIQVGTLWARLSSGRDTSHLRKALDRTTHEEEWSVTTEEKLKESVKFGLEKCNLFYGRDWVFQADINQGEPMAKRPKTEMALSEEHGDGSNDPKPETDKTTDKPDLGESMTKTTDKPEDDMVPKEATDGEVTYDIRNIFFDSEDDDDELYNPERNDADGDDGQEQKDGLTKPGTETTKNELNHVAVHDNDPNDGADGDDSEDDDDELYNPERNGADDEDGQEQKDGLTKPGTETAKNELNHVAAHDNDPNDGADGDDSVDDDDELYNPVRNDADDEDGQEQEDGLTKPGTETAKNELNYIAVHDNDHNDGADGDDNNIHDKEANIKKLAQQENVPGSLGRSVIVRHDKLFEKEEHLYDRFIPFGQIEDIVSMEGSLTEDSVPEQVVISFASDPIPNIFNLNGPSLGIFPMHETQLWLKRDDMYLINVSGKNWPLKSLKGVILNETDVPAEVFNCPLLVKMKPRVLRGDYYNKTSVVMLRGLARLATRRDRLTLTGVNQKTKTTLPGRTDMDNENFAAKTMKNGTHMSVSSH